MAPLRCILDRFLHISFGDSDTALSKLVIRFILGQRPIRRVEPLTDGFSRCAEDKMPAVDELLCQVTQVPSGEAVHGFGQLCPSGVHP